MRELDKAILAAKKDTADMINHLEEIQTKLNKAERAYKITMVILLILCTINLIITIIRTLS